MFLLIPNKQFTWNFTMKYIWQIITFYNIISIQCISMWSVNLFCFKFLAFIDHLYIYLQGKTKRKSLKLILSSLRYWKWTLFDLKLITYTCTYHCYDFLLILLQEPSREKALTIATTLLTLPTPPSVQQHTKSLMASLFPTTPAYYNHKV